MARTPYAPSPLAADFGHEEDLSQHLGTVVLADLLAHVGIGASGPVSFEVPVENGHHDRAGRLDILVPTAAGTVIVETQYGTSDSCHLRRLPGYARSVAAPLCVVWVAEQFRAKDILTAEAMEIPVLCLQVIRLDHKRVELRSAAINSKPLGSLAERIKAHQQLVGQLAKKFDRDMFANYCAKKRNAWSVEFIPERPFVSYYLEQYLGKKYVPAKHRNNHHISSRGYNSACRAWRGSQAELFVCHAHLIAMPLVDEVMAALHTRRDRLVSNKNQRKAMAAAAQ